MSDDPSGRLGQSVTVHGDIGKAIDTTSSIAFICAIDPTTRLDTVNSS